MSRPQVTRPAGVLLSAALLTGCGGAPTGTAASSASSASSSSSSPPSPAGGTAAVPGELTGIDALERRYSARVGAWVLDTGTGEVLGHRIDERFAHASTIKLVLVGLLLQQVSDADLDTTVPVEATDVLEYAPVTSQYVGVGLPLREVMRAAIVVSDNTAANLLVEQLGGPAQVQALLRGLGNTTTNVDRTEPTLNEATPGDPRDTSTPAGLGATVEQLVLGDALPPERRALLQQWLQDTTTGDAAIRAGVPAGWTVGDKTGSGGYGTRNDVAVVQPADGGAPLVVVLLTDRGAADADSEDGLLADITRAVVEQVGR